MRWQMADRIHAFEPWQQIAGCKAVSLEEASLLNRMGRPDCLPDGLLVEAAVQFGRWLVIASSDFQQHALLQEVEGLRIELHPHMGDVLQYAVEVKARNDGSITCALQIRFAERVAAEGRLMLQIAPLAGYAEETEIRRLWQGIHGTT